MVRIDKQVKLVDIKDISPYKNNNKRHSANQITKLALHIESVGWDVPIVIDENNVILKGHGRLEAAKKLALTEVPCIQKKGLTEAQKKAVRIADNKISQLSEWDDEAVKRELEDLELSGFELESLGYEVKELDELLRDINFEPGSEDDQGKLDEKKKTVCPECGHEF